MSITHDPTSGTTGPDRTLVSRRRLLGAGAGAAGAAALGACADDGPNLPADGEIVSVRTPSVPRRDPASPLWDEAPPTVVALEGQITAPPYRLEPVVADISVRSLHDRDDVALLVEWDDPRPDAATVANDGFRDACAVLLGDPAAGEELRFMGTQQHPVTLLQWKADWQHDVEHGVRTIDDEYPDRSVDAYPPIVTDDPLGITPADYVTADATPWLPGLHVGNLLSAPTRTRCVEKMIAYGFGTTTTTDTQDADGWGRHHGGRWAVVVTKPLAAHDAGELHLRPRGSATCAFAVWSGADGDAGGKKSVSTRTYRLVLREAHGPSPFPS